MSKDVVGMLGTLVLPSLPSGRKVEPTVGVEVDTILIERPPVVCQPVLPSLLRLATAVTPGGGGSMARFGDASAVVLVMERGWPIVLVPVTANTPGGGRAMTRMLMVLVTVSTPRGGHSMTWLVLALITASTLGGGRSMTWLLLASVTVRRVHVQDDGGSSRPLDHQSCHRIVDPCGGSADTPTLRVLLGVSQLQR